MLKNVHLNSLKQFTLKWKLIFHLFPRLGVPCFTIFCYFVLNVGGLILFYFLFLRFVLCFPFGKFQFIMSRPVDYIQSLEMNFGLRISRPDAENIATARSDFLTLKNFAFGQIMQSTANIAILQTIVAEFEADFFAANDFILEDLKVHYRVPTTETPNVQRWTIWLKTNNLLHWSTTLYFLYKFIIHI